MFRKLSTYNSESELFTISFNINEVKWQNTLNIQISKAEKFKDQWPILGIKIDDFDWCFVKNNLCPSIVTLNYNSSKYEFPLTLKNRMEISYSFDDFGIPNQYLKGYVFKFSEAKRIEEELMIEAKRIDSLELLTYNKKLDSIFNDYNTKLLNNPYNTKNKKMTQFKVVLKNDENRDYSFKTSLNSIQYNYEQMYNSFEREIKSQNPSEFCRIYFSLNMDEKVEADKKYIECRCYYRERVNFDIAFIENKLNSCNCRDKEFQENGKLFLSQEEFNGFYNQGDDSLQKEIKTRIFKKEEEIALNRFKSKASKIETLDLKGSKNKDIKKEKDAWAKYYIDQIYDNNNKPYYSSIIGFFIETNKGLKKEWSKNKEFFDNKVEFFEAYISSNYKQILKNKKQK